MSKSMHEDREKMIAEIRMDLTFISGEQSAGKWMGRCRFLLSELERIESVGLQWHQMYKKAKSEWEHALSELSREREESRKLREQNRDLLNDYDNVITDRAELERRLKNECKLNEKLVEENQKLREEREVLIEGLRWYADEDRWIGMSDMDSGKRARDILKECGVTVE